MIRATVCSTRTVFACVYSLHSGSQVVVAAGVTHHLVDGLDHYSPDIMNMFVAYLVPFASGDDNIVRFDAMNC